MFFDPGRIGAVREMILAEDEKGRRAALAKLLPMQRQDFVDLFRIMQGLPVTIRLLDPPLHEFLPHSDFEIAEVAQHWARHRTMKRRAQELSEVNPMLGFRGCRLGIAFPEIAEMQARAIFEAAARSARRPARPASRGHGPARCHEAGTRPDQGARIDRDRRKSFAETVPRRPISVGTMIELPRAALTADAIAERRILLLRHQRPDADRFGISRDDAGKLPPLLHVAKGIFPNPTPSSRSTRTASANW
jgi:pyruvate,orthophosphate dikinase